MIDIDFPLPLKKLAAEFGLKPRTLRTQFDKSKLELIKIANKLFGTKRQVMEMFEKCRVQKKKQDSSGKPRSAGAEVSGLSETERIEKARASITSTLLQSRKQKLSPPTEHDTTKPPRA